MDKVLKKFIKILFVIEFILILTIIILTLTDNLNNKIPTAYAVKENHSIEKADFKVFTRAVCEEKTEHISCRDELFVKCNGKEYMARENLYNFTDCKNIKLNLSNAKVSGHTTFEKGWDDPRTKTKVFK